MTLLQSLQEQIAAKEAEIAYKQSRIDLLKDGIKIDHSVLSMLKKGYSKLKEKYADEVDQETVDKDASKV